MSETTAIVTSIIGSGGLIVAMLGLMIRGMNSQFTQTNQRIEDVRTDLKERLNDTNRRIDDTRSELNSRIEESNRHLERVETRVDQIGRDIGELRDRTGKLEGTVSTFIQSQGKVEAA